tara:strand:- start:119 stop:292 length:174 start_codon:yes stop_codon:yes gene_type:complete
MYTNYALKGEQKFTGIKEKEKTYLRPRRTFPSVRHAHNNDVQNDQNPDEPVESVIIR